MVASAGPLAAWQQVCNTHQLTDSILQSFSNELSGDLVLPTDGLYDWGSLDS